MALDSEVLLAGLLAGGAVVGVGLAAGALRRQGDPVRRRLLRPRPTPRAIAAAPAADPATGPAPENGLARGVAAIARIAQGKDGEVNQLRAQLVQAGLRGEFAAKLFLAAKVLLAVVLPTAFAIYNSTQTEPTRLAIPIAIWMCAGGFFLPNLWLSSKVQKRRTAIERGLPDALDLLVTCVEAGQGLDASLQRVAGDTALSAPVLAEELNLTFLEINAGIPRAEAFRRLYDRTGVDELKSLAATLAQAEMFGTSIGLALRIQAGGIRTRRMHRAEERAAIVSVKMTVPLVLCILPSLLAIIMGPAAVNIYNSVFNKLGGGSP